MPSGPFFFKDPISLTLAADQRFAPFDAEIDAVWQLSLEPHKAMAMVTSFGLQARKFSLFPVFLINRRPVWIINDFFSQPRIDEIYSNYASLACTPAAGVQARYELWVESSNSLLCRITLQNLTNAKTMLGIQAVAELLPLEGTVGMTPAVLQYQPYLWGKSGNLYIALAVAGIAMQAYSPFSALQNEQKIDPQGTLTFVARCSIAQAEQACPAKGFSALPGKLGRHNGAPKACEAYGHDPCLVPYG